MFARCARVAPACMRDSSPANFTASCFSFCSTVTPRLSGSDREPLAPFTVTESAAMVAVTPCGRSTARFATRDIRKYLLPGSGDDAQDFAALADGARLLVRHHALRRGDDHGTHAAEHLRQLVLAAIDAQAGTAHALEAVDDGLALEILEAHGQHGLAAVVGDAEVGDVALVLQHAHHGRLHLRGR